MRENQTLTGKQEKVYGFIKGYISKQNEAPTVSEIAKEIRARSLRGVTQYLESLERKGLIQRDRYAKRGIRLVEHDPTHDELIPIRVFASAGCGSPSIIAERTFDEFAMVPKDLAPDKKDDLFVIKAAGNSMLDAGIRDGDMVLVQMTNDVRANDLVVAIIDDTAVIKKITFANNAVILNPVSHNSSYHPIILKRDFKVFGKVVRVIKIEKNEEYHVVPLEESNNEQKY